MAALALERAKVSDGYQPHEFHKFKAVFFCALDAHFYFLCVISNIRLGQQEKRNDSRVKLQAETLLSWLLLQWLC